MFCTLCSYDVDKSLNIRGRDYFLCPNCDLLFMSPQDRMTREEELQRYLKHQNDPADTGYKNFLLQLAEPCFEYIDKDSLCLDYGCGNELNMEKIFKDKGYNMQNYDPYFYPNGLKGPYDLIVCNEVCEHFYSPSADFIKIRNILKPDGILAIGTNLRNATTDLNTWHYLSDRTHVSMYSKKTFDTVAERYKFKVLKVLNDRVILLKAFTLA